MLDLIFKKDESTPQNLKSSDRFIPLPQINKNIQNVHPEPKKIEVEPITEQEIAHDRLLTVLYWIWDAFDRALMNMFLIGPTAEQVKEQSNLHGNKIYCGIRKLEWRSGGRRIFDAFAGEPLKETETKAVYHNSGVDVEVYFFDDDICINTTDQVLYRNENFRLPSPYARFIEKFGEVWKLP